MPPTDGHETPLAANMPQMQFGDSVSKEGFHAALAQASLKSVKLNQCPPRLINFAVRPWAGALRFPRSGRRQAALPGRD